MPFALLTRSILAAVMLSRAVAQAPDAPRLPIWKLDYFFDKDRSSLTVADAVFVSPSRAILAGGIDEKEKRRNVIGRSSDAGKTWTFDLIKESPVALFFINENKGWLATQKSIQTTSDGGRTWQKLNPMGGMRRLYFFDEKRGFAIGSPKAAFSTRDGGATWDPIEAAQKPGSNPDTTIYEGIAFAGKVGVIFGSSYPPRRQNGVPEWADPGLSASTRQVPTLTIALTSVDGGDTWYPATAPLFGHPQATVLSTSGYGLTVFRYDNQFEVPSEVYRTDMLNERKIRSVFKRKDRLVTDVYIRPNGGAILAAIEPPGQSPLIAIPAKVKMLISADGITYAETKVDYRVTARSVFFCRFGDTVWAFTDTGMLLRLVE